MNTRTIDGKSFAKMLYGGAARLSAHIDELNALNVFPVADGDTGTNMSKTMEGGLAELDGSESIGALSRRFSRGALLGARGNSGVILSQIFAGITELLESYDSVGASELAVAYRGGIKKSYSAVQNPTEGTILTVFRESTEYAAANINEESTVEDFLRLHITEAHRSLLSTKELLGALAEADVVDSGAAGYLYIAEGMLNALTGKTENIEYKPSEKKEKGTLNIDLFGRDSVLEYGYCTEFLLRLMTAKVDPDTFAIETILKTLGELGGESIVAYKQDDVVKVHVHTFRPGDVLAKMQQYGEFLTVKIENMSLGHSESEKKKQRKKFSVVAVASGDGMEALFSDMGADGIISGGQTLNPSTEDFIKAFEKCDAENIIVLPNNKNVILAARQSADLYGEAKVHIIETKNMMQGFGALSVITPGIKDMDALVSSAARAAEGVLDIEVTRAVRDASVGGRQIEMGEYMAISGGEISAVAENAEDAVMLALESADTDLCEIITLFVGKDVSDEKRVALTERIENEYADCELVVYNGGQDVYDYFIAIE